MGEPTRIDQTKFGKGEGNCFAACVAMLTGLDLDTLADAFAMWSDGGTYDEAGNWTRTPGEEHWFDRARRVVGEYGWEMDYDTSEAPSGFCIASGPASRGLLHSTVALDGKLWHDPHPSRDGLIAVSDYIWLTRPSATLSR